MKHKDIVYPRLLKSTVSGVVICATGPAIDEDIEGRFNGILVDTGGNNSAFIIGEKIKGWDLNYFVDFHGLVIIDDEHGTTLKNI
jgi:hypothetical protein